MVMPVPDGHDWTLLPEHSTDFEHALEIVLRPDARLTAAIQALQGIKQNPPDAYLPVLADEYGLLPIVPYLPDLRTAITQGLLWQKERCTEQAIRRALSWINVWVAAFEEAGQGRHWREIQLDPGQIPDDARIMAIRALTKLSARAVTVLRRLYHGYDVRRLVLDNSNCLDAHLLDNDSGVLMDGLWRSFGRERQRGLYTGQQQTIARLVRRLQISAVHHPDRWLLDITPVFDELELRHPQTLRGRLRIGGTPRTSTIRQHHHSRVSFAALVPDETLQLDAINAVLDPRCFVAGDSWPLDVKRLDTQANGYWRPVDRYYENHTRRHTHNHYTPAVAGWLQHRQRLYLHRGEQAAWPLLDMALPSPTAQVLCHRLHSRYAAYDAAFWTTRWLNQRWSTTGRRVSKVQGAVQGRQLIRLSDYRASHARQRTQSKAVGAVSPNALSIYSGVARQRHHRRNVRATGAFWPSVRWRNARVTWQETGHAVSGVLHARTG